MITVLPTPAPPNNPILPPRRYGSRRSMTLIPVSNICSSVACSSNAGAWRWMGYRLAVFTGPILSTGSPITFSTRPSVSLPTGTVTGSPRLSARMPRTRPSVGCRAMVRTRLSPMCCATSQIILMGSGTLNPSLVMRIAVRMTGICPSGNSTSTAGPATWITFPNVITILFWPGVPGSCTEAKTFSPERGLAQSRRAADDFNNLARDAGLPHTVHIQRELVDHFVRVGRRRVHRRHARGQLRRRGFQQRPVHPHLYVAGQKAAQHFLGLLFVNIIDRRSRLRHLDRQNTGDDGVGRHYALELVDEQVHGIDFGLGKALDHNVGDPLGVFVAHQPEQIQMLAVDRQGAPAEIIARL